MTSNNIHVELCGMLPNVAEHPPNSALPPAFSLFQTLSDKRTVYIHPPDAPPKAKQMNESSRCLLLNIEIDAYSAEKIYDFPLVPPKPMGDTLNNLLNSIFVADNQFDRMSISYQIAKEMLASAKEKDAPLSMSINGVAEYIRKNYNKRITISDLANLLGISESGLYSTFKRQFGMSPISYLNDFRLAASAKLLVSTQSSIDNIAQTVGIDDFRYYSKIFKRKYGMTPTSYRKINKTR